MIWFTADTHFGHHNIIKYCNRPFSSIAEMDAAMINNINKCVKQDDILYHLGDFCWGSNKVVHYYLRQLQCQNIHLILGNHDKHIRRYPNLQKCFKQVDDIYKLTTHTHVIILCHYSMRVWPQKHYGAIQLFGHSHGTLVIPGERTMDVGMDVHNFMPININKVLEVCENVPV